MAKKTTENMDKTELEIKNEELENMKKELAELKKLLVNQSKNVSLDADEIPDIPLNKTVRVMSLFTGMLNLKVANDGSGQVFKLEKVGQIIPIMYSDLVKIIANQRKFFEEGYCMILDKDVVKAQYLDEHYEKFIDGKTINEFLDNDNNKIVEMFSNTTKVIQQSIVDIIISKINKNDYVDKNKVAAISKIYENDIFDLAKQMA